MKLRVCSPAPSSSSSTIIIIVWLAAVAAAVRLLLLDVVLLLPFQDLFLSSSHPLSLFRRTNRSRCPSALVVVVVVVEMWLVVVVAMAVAGVPQPLLTRGGMTPDTTAITTTIRRMIRITVMTMHTFFFLVLVTILAVSWRVTTAFSVKALEF